MNPTTVGCSYIAGWPQGAGTSSTPVTISNFLGLKEQVIVSQQRKDQVLARRPDLKAQADFIMKQLRGVCTP